VIAPTLFLVVGSLVVAGLCWGGGRLLSRALGRRTPFWRLQVPWTAFHAYLVIALYAGGGLPTSARGFFVAAAVTGAATGLGGLAFRVRRAGGGARALFWAWALPWGIAALLDLF
jgi:hypothetical protein